MPLSKEKIEQIREDADKFALQVPYNGTNDFYDKDRFDAYIAGATAEAEKAQCLIEVLEKIVDACVCNESMEAAGMAEKIATAALQSYTNSK